MASPDASAPPLPSTLGPDNRYVICKLLGSGSFGVVFSAVGSPAHPLLAARAPARAP